MVNPNRQMHVFSQSCSQYTFVFFLPIRLFKSSFKPKIDQVHVNSPSDLDPRATVTSSVLESWTKNKFRSKILFSFCIMFLFFLNMVQLDYLVLNTSWHTIFGPRHKENQTSSFMAYSRPNSSMGKSVTKEIVEIIKKTVISNHKFQVRGEPVRFDNI